MEKRKIYVGCSGFYNNDWKGSLYSEDAKSKDFLTLYSQQFNSVEINSTFYRKPLAKTLIKWFDELPIILNFSLKFQKRFPMKNVWKIAKKRSQNFVIIYKLI